LTECEAQVIFLGLVANPQNHGKVMTFLAGYSAFLSSYIHPIHSGSPMDDLALIRSSQAGSVAVLLLMVVKVLFCRGCIADVWWALQVFFSIWFAWIWHWIIFDCLCGGLQQQQQQRKDNDDGRGVVRASIRLHEAMDTFTVNSQFFWEIVCCYNSNNINHSNIINIICSKMVMQQNRFPQCNITTHRIDITLACMWYVCLVLLLYAKQSSQIWLYLACWQR